jgi:hypothetical protein
MSSRLFVYGGIFSFLQDLYLQASGRLYCAALKFFKDERLMNVTGVSVSVTAIDIFCDMRHNPVESDIDSIATKPPNNSRIRPKRQVIPIQSPAEESDVIG